MVEEVSRIASIAAPYSSFLIPSRSSSLFLYFPI